MGPIIFVTLKSIIIIVISVWTTKRTLYIQIIITLAVTITHCFKTEWNLNKYTQYPDYEYIYIFYRRYNFLICIRPFGFRRSMLYHVYVRRIWFACSKYAYLYYYILILPWGLVYFPNLTLRCYSVAGKRGNEINKKKL